MLDLEKAVEILKAGGLVAFPTETVYGLGADACNDKAVAGIFAAKGRPQFNPLIAHVADFTAAQKLAEFSPAACQLAKAFWPGPLTLVLPRKENCPVSLLASSGLASIAIRVPAHDMALALLQKYGGPLVAPSANASGGISPTTPEHVRASLGTKAKVILEGGPCKVGLESTIVSFIDDTPRLLRAGGLDRSTIESVLGQKLESPISGPLHAPGQLESHYAPKAKMRLNANKWAQGEVCLGFGACDAALNLSREGNLTQAAANLFAMLHELDKQGAEIIAVAPIPNIGIGEAINDRLQRAAAPRLS